jgi:hypothetical protein
VPSKRFGTRPLFFPEHDPAAVDCFRATEQMKKGARKKLAAGMIQALP